ncbi:hypothetical protein B0T38_22030 [Chromobacterium violaceum]|nr:hypothetical protein B0T38_22030 [Chromobacterium violaceum]
MDAGADLSLDKTIHETIDESIDEFIDDLAENSRTGCLCGYNWQTDSGRSPEARPLHWRWPAYVKRIT